ncbi:MAG: PAS domain-containing protein [Boseongicola sp.]
MLTTSTHRAPEDILGALEFTPNPMFILSVEDQQEFRFLGANAAYSQVTGLAVSEIADKRPDEVLPPRAANVALVNYRACCASGSKYTFHENLDLPDGRRWWLTTLAPISDNNGIHTIVGSSVDISSLKDAFAIQSLAYQRLHRRADQWHVVAANAVQDARGPLNNILSLSRMLKREPDSAKEIGSIASLLEETAARSLQKIDQRATNADAIANKEPECVDFGQLCREFATLADPQARLKINFPECVLEVDEAMLRLFLNTIVDQVAKHTATFINLKLLPSQIDRSTRRLILEFDAPPGSRINMMQLDAICQVHVTNIRHVIHNAIHRIEFHLPVASYNAESIAARGTKRIQAIA